MIKTFRADNETVFEGNNYVVCNATSPKLASMIADALNVMEQRKSAATRRELSKAVSEFVAPNYFKAIPIEDLAEIVDKHGFNGDAVRNEASNLSGNEGRIACMVSDNMALAMTYYKMPSGKWEIVAYVS